MLEDARSREDAMLKHIGKLLRAVVAPVAARSPRKAGTASPIGRAGAGLAAVRADSFVRGPSIGQVSATPITLPGQTRPEGKAEDIPLPIPKPAGAEKPGNLVDAIPINIP
jgi:hypothetical protein